MSLTSQSVKLPVIAIAYRLQLIVNIGGGDMLITCKVVGDGILYILSCVCMMILHKRVIVMKYIDYCAFVVRCQNSIRI